MAHRYVEVDRETAEAFFAARGTVYLISAGAPLWVPWELSRVHYQSIAQGVAQWFADQTGPRTPLLLIAEDDPHPENPIGQIIRVIEKGTA